MNLENLFCQKCLLKIKILELLEDSSKSFAEIAKFFQKNPTAWSWGRKHLEKLEKTGLVKKVGKKQFRWYITSEGRNFLSSLKDPCLLKVYLAGSSTATKVLRSLGFKIPYLMGAGIYWNGKRFTIHHPLNFASEIFIDSGAQQFYKKFQGLEYPYSVKEYVNFAISVNADLIATLDLPLDILTPRGLPVKEGIEKTVEYGVAVIDEAQKLGIKNRIVPVLQGFDDPTQWILCLDLYKSYGVKKSPSGIWGIGSLCMMKGYKLPKIIVWKMREEIKNEKLHVFGLSLTALKHVYHLIDSFDTSVWIYWAKMDGAFFCWDPYHRRFVQGQVREGKRYDTLALMRMNVRAIFDMVNDLNQTKMSEFRNL